MAGLTWLSIFRIGLVQTALGSMVVLTTSTLNRVMTIELASLAMLPGALLALHHAVQIARPKWGYNSDMGGRRTPWIIGGLAVLAVGVLIAALATAWMSTAPTPGIVLAVFAYILIGIGVGASGTSLLAMLASEVAPGRRAPAATIVWIMMIMGFVVTSVVASANLDPFSFTRLVAVTAGVVAVAFIVAVVAVWGVESSVPTKNAAPETEKPSFVEAFEEIWAEPKARAFTIFVFISMFAYATQDLILEPFAGAVFGMTPGESTGLTGVQSSGVLLGLLIVGFAAGGKDRPRFGSVRVWTVGGCVASAIALMALMISGYVAGWPLRPTVFALGLSNGAFAAAAIGWMMTLAGDGRASREGVRMGLWGGAQAIGFALGGFLGTVGVDAVRYLFDSRVLSYAAVFGAEGALFLVSAILAARMQMVARTAESGFLSTDKHAPSLGAAGLSS